MPPDLLKGLAELEQAVTIGRAEDLPVKTAGLHPHEATIHRMAEHRRTRRIQPVPVFKDDRTEGAVLPVQVVLHRLAHGFSMSGFVHSRSTSSVPGMESVISSMVRLAAIALIAQSRASQVRSPPSLRS